MTKPYDFSRLPVAEDFDFVTPSLEPLGEAPRSREAGEDFAIRIALENVQSHPDDRHACDLSFSRHDPLYVPVRDYMIDHDVLKMKTHMEKAEFFLMASRTIGQDFRNLQRSAFFRGEIRLMSSVDPNAANTYMKAAKANDFLQIQKALFGLHKSVLGEAKKFFDSFDNLAREISPIETLIAEALPIRGQQVGSSLDAAALK